MGNSVISKEVPVQRLSVLTASYRGMNHVFTSLKCDQCSYSTQHGDFDEALSFAIDHVKQCYGARPIIYVRCDYCKEVFKNANLFKNHLDEQIRFCRQHIAKGTVRCEYCRMPFKQHWTLKKGIEANIKANQEDMERHIAAYAMGMIQGDNMTQCPTCNRWFDLLYMDKHPRAIDTYCSSCAPRN
jgi:hypothetical protein